MNTNLIYMSEGGKLDHQATVIDVLEGGTVVVLDETVFYPQGGGQACDMGVIAGDGGTFQVAQVRNVEGVVHHIGQFARGSFAPGDTVALRVDADRRRLNTRLHSAGHIVDLAAHRLGYRWRAGKGYHFPDGPYVEYAEGIEGVDLEKVKAELAAEVARCVSENLKVRIEFMSRGEMEKALDNVPAHIPENRPSRVVFMGDYGVPCGGTHVMSTGEVGSLEIRDVKMKKGSLRISYLVG